MRLLSKRRLHRATRGRQEGYAPVLAPDGRGLAFLEVQGDHERVMWLPLEGPAHPISSPGFCWPPRFAGSWLVWVQANGERWRLMGTPSDRLGTAEPRVLAERPGRPVNLAADSRGRSGWIAWEERVGRRTQIWALELTDTGCRPEAAISPPEINAYDPAIARANDGSLFCAYGAFSEGNYRVYLRQLAPGAAAWTGPLRLTERAEACVWPSLWPGQQGGVWFSFTAYCVPTADRPDQTQALSYVKHDRYRQQRGCFGWRGLAHVGFCAGASLLAPKASSSRGDGQFFTGAGMVFASDGAGHTQVLEGNDGGIHLVLRQHVAAEAGSEDQPWEEEDEPLRHHPRFVPRRPDQMHPSVTISTLADGQRWAAPRMVVARAHFDLPLALRCDGRVLEAAFGEDGRLTGWSGSAERSDSVGEVALGFFRVELDRQPAPELVPLAVAPFPAGDLANPRPADPPAALGPGLNYALGQTHCHSSLSVCRREADRDPHFNYRFMQDVQGCRFGLLTDHDYNLWATETLLIRKLAEYYDFPGEFVALPGYEWTGSDPHDCSHDGGPFGHVNVLSFGLLPAGDFHSPSDPDSPGRSLPRLWHELACRSVLTPPHHVVDAKHPYHWDFWRGDYQPVVEIFQDDRGSGEQASAPGLTNAARANPAPWAVNQLLAGKRFGFIAGGDHSGLALAGLWTRALTRDGLLEAFRARRVYATTGIHAALAWTCNQRVMGQDDAGTPARFRLTVASFAAPARVEVLRSGALWRTVDGRGEREWEWSAPEAAAGEFWYCRVHWSDGELAWTSPIWI